MTYVLGLTGSIGMGKSTTATLFRAAGVPVHDADATVHALYRGAAVPRIEAAFPGTTREGQVDRSALSARVLSDDQAMAQLEALVHPLVLAAEERFLATCRHQQHPLCVLDIPLLFETGAEGRCDAILVATAPEAVQKSRVMARPGMTPERFNAILARQMPDSRKRAGAHFCIDTSQGLEAARRQVDALIRALAGRAGRAAAGRENQHHDP